MSYPTYHHGAHTPGLPQQPTCWLAASKLPVTPPNQCSDGFRQRRRENVSPPRMPLPLRRPSLAVDCNMEGHGTPALSYTSSSGGSRSSTMSSGGPVAPESSFGWQNSASPEHLPPPHTSSISPTRTLMRSHGLRAIDADLQHELARKKLESFASMAAGAQGDHEDSDFVSAHPRIVKASTDRRPGFVEGLVDVSEIAITSIWASAAAEANIVADDGSVLPLRWFIKETLRRSRTSCSTLQLALFYLHKGRMRIRDRVVMAERAKVELQRLAASDAYPTPPASPQSQELPLRPDAQQAADLLAVSRDPLCCGRRMFLASLVCASKFLQDRNYSSRAWSKISGLSVHEINANERALLHVLDYELFVRADLFANWTQRLENLANEYARQHGIDYGAQDELPAMPTSPVGSHSATLPQHPATLQRSASEYAPAPQPGSDMHATLPTPILSNTGNPALGPMTLRRGDSERVLETCATQTRRASSRLSDQDSVVSGWLASQQRDNPSVH